MSKCIKEEQRQTAKNYSSLNCDIFTLTVQKMCTKEYIDRQPEKHQKILKELRLLILRTFPGIEEGFLWGVPVYDKGRFYLASLKKQINLGFSIVGLDKDDIDLFEGSGKTARYIKIFELIDQKEKDRIVELVKLVKSKAGLPK
jgi:hypothetical protein